MIIVEVDGRRVEIPSKYSEIKVTEFTKLWKVLNKYDLTQEEDEIKRGIDEMDCTIEVCAMLLGISREEANGLPYDKASEIIGIFNGLLSEDNQEDDYSGWSFVHYGEGYYFPKLSLDKMTFGEYAEVKQIESMLGKNVDDRFDFIPQQMAILCRKSGEGKNDFDRDERTKEFETLTMDIVMKFAFFLSRLNIRLSKSTAISMAKPKELEKS